MTGTNETNTVQDILDRSVFTLASDADCGSPDHHDSAGANFLNGVRNDVLNSWEGNDDPDLAEWSDISTEIADGAPSVYTHPMWMQFVDLQAYHEDISDYGDYGDDLNKAAAVALYTIAYRLADSLFMDLVEARQEDADEADDEDS